MLGKNNTMVAKENKKHVSEKKINEVKRLVENFKNSRCVLIVSIKSVPSPQLQKIKKDLRGKANLKIVKKNILIRAIEESKIPELEGLKEKVNADCAIAFSNEDAFDLAAWLTENRSPISAKEGQIAEEDIKIEAGPTELMPGPAISELGAVGLKVNVEEGKIAIRESKVIVKKGGSITSDVASVLQKLDIKPFMVGLDPAVIYDSATKKIYVGIKINKKKIIEDLVSLKAKAVGLAVNLSYTCKETIGMLLAKADSHFKALNKLENSKD